MVCQPLRQTISVLLTLVVAPCGAPRCACANLANQRVLSNMVAFAFKY